MKKIKKIFFIPLFLGILWFSFVYAAVTVVDFTNVNIVKGDIISSTWYNLVNKTLNWPHTEWGICTYSNWKIMCNTSLPSANNPGNTSQPTILLRQTLVAMGPTAEDSRTQWNNYIKQWTDFLTAIDAATGLDYSQKCRSWDANLADWSKSFAPNWIVNNPGSDWESLVNRCGGQVCKAVLKSQNISHFGLTSEAAHCWDNTNVSCPKGAFTIVCIY